MSFNLENGLDKIKCKLLVIAGDFSNYYIAKYDSIPLCDAVEGSKFLQIEDMDDLNIINYLYKIEDKIKEFLDSV